MIYVLDILLFILLFFAAKEDLNDAMVSDKYTITFVMLALIFSNASFASKLLAILITIIAVKFDKSLLKIGAADIILYAGLVARFGFICGTQGLIIICLLALLQSAIKKEKSVRMVPIFLIAYPFFIICF